MNNLNQELVDFNKSVVETFNKVQGTLQDLVTKCNSLQTQINTLKKEMDEISVIENDTVPAGEYNLVEGWDDGPKVTVK
jgi:chaperonin cofactor prefoldin